MEAWFKGVVIAGAQVLVMEHEHLWELAKFISNHAFIDLVDVVDPFHALEQEVR